MRVVVTGASGFIGRALVASLAARGDEVIALSRDPSATKALMPGLSDALTWKPVNEPAPAGAFESADAVVNLAGERMTGRWTGRKKLAILETRERATHNLVAGMREGSVTVIVSGSALGYYGDRGDELLQEDSPQGSGFLSEVCKRWEDAALQAPSHTRVVLLRTGFVIGSQGGFLKPLKAIAKLGLSGPLASGRQWWSWVHLVDAVGLIIHALENETVQGPVNVCAPQAVRQRDFARALSELVRRPSLLPAPSFALKWVLGEFASEVLSSRRMIPKVALTTGYGFHHPELEAALSDS